MPNFHVTIQLINGVCTAVPHQIPPPGGKVVHNDTVQFGNQTSGTATLNFSPPNGSPFGTNPISVPTTGTQPLPITVNPTQQTTYTYQVSCSGTGGLTGGDGGGGI